MPKALEQRRVGGVARSSPPGACAARRQAARPGTPPPAPPAPPPGRPGASLNARQRIDGSTPCTSTRSRGARGAVASKISTVGHAISRVWLLVEADARAVGLEVVELLRVDPREAARVRAPRPGTTPRSTPRRPRRSSPGTRTPSPGPSGRPDGGPRSAAASEPPYIMRPWLPPRVWPPTRARPDRRNAALRRGRRRRFRVHAQGAPDLPRRALPT